jgi:hypothetical protein
MAYVLRDQSGGVDVLHDRQVFLGRRPTGVAV